MIQQSQLAIVFVTVILVGGAAQAQLSSEQQSALKSNCRSDFMANCSGVTPGSRDALMCLQKNVANLSPGCQAAVKSTMPAPAAAAPLPPKAAAPMPAAPTPAATATPAPAAPPPAASATSAPATAMAPPPAAKRTKAATPQKQDNTAVATPAPAPMAAPAAPPVPMGRIENLSARVRLQVMRACNADQDAVCPNVQRGGGRIVACLAAHQQSLSPRCRETLAKALQ